MTSIPTPQPKKQEDTGELERTQIIDILLGYALTEPIPDRPSVQPLTLRQALNAVVQLVTDHTAKAVAEAEDRVHREVCPTCKAIESGLKGRDA